MRKIGIEFELTYQTDEVVETDEIYHEKREALRTKFERAFPNERINSRDIGYYHSTGETWDFKTDSSVQTTNREDVPLEIATPILTYPNDLQLLYDVVSFLEEYCLAVPSGGMHVHLDVSDLSIVNIFNIRQMVALTSEFFMRMGAARRCSSTYCAAPRVSSISVTDLSLKKFREWCAASPRDAINLGLLSKRNTVEVRYYHSTLVWEEIENWLLFLNLFLANVKKIKIPVASSSHIQNPATTIREYFDYMLGKDSYPESMYEFFQGKILECAYQTKSRLSNRILSAVVNNKKIVEVIEKCAG